MCKPRTPVQQYGAPDTQRQENCSSLLPVGLGLPLRILLIFIVLLPMVKRGSRSSPDFVEENACVLHRPLSPTIAEILLLFLASLDVPFLITARFHYICY